MRLVIYVFAILTLLNSCKKEKNKTYIIKGRFINSCDGSPIVNQAVNISQNGSKGGMYGKSLNGVYLRSFTDENGVFEIEYETNHTAPLKLNSCEGIPIENLDLGDIAFSFSPKVFYKVKVNNPYTNFDTLRFSFTDNGTAPAYFMNGPFHDTIIGLKNLNNIGWFNYKYDEGSKKLVTTDTAAFIYFSYRININSSTNPLGGNQEKIVKNCNTITDTVVLNIN